jgi:hypothetical protein
METPDRRRPDRDNPPETPPDDDEDWRTTEPVPGQTTPGQRVPADRSRGREQQRPGGVDSDVEDGGTPPT